MSNFGGKRVLALESRRSKELATLITTYGGEPILAPAMREVPLDSNREALDFVTGLARGDFDVVVFLTGVGTRLLAEIAAKQIGKDQFASALRQLRVVARGPKPTAALRDLGVTPNAVAPEPNTWRELLGVLDREVPSPGLQNLRLAVQEYGEPAEELFSALQERGARVTRVPLYRWALPEDLSALQSAIKSVTDNKIAVVLFTTSAQIDHLFKVASEMKMEEPLRAGLQRCVIASIGPTTSEELRGRGLQADMEASPPKMGVLVKEAAEKCNDLLAAKTKQVAI
jgi:uroporphyrinogen-III synthase